MNAARKGGGRRFATRRWTAVNSGACCFEFGEGVGRARRPASVWRLGPRYLVDWPLRLHLPQLAGTKVGSGIGQRGRLAQIDRREREAQREHGLGRRRFRAIGHLPEVDETLGAFGHYGMDPGGGETDSSVVG